MVSAVRLRCPGDSYVLAVGPRRVVARLTPQELLSPPLPPDYESHRQIVAGTEAYEILTNPIVTIGIHGDTRGPMKNEFPKVLQARSGRGERI